MVPQRGSSNVHTAPWGGHGTTLVRGDLTCLGSDAGPLSRKGDESPPGD